MILDYQRPQFSDIREFRSRLVACLDLGDDAGAEEVYGMIRYAHSIASDSVATYAGRVLYEFEDVMIERGLITP